jgi:hypothetical protein
MIEMRLKHTVGESLFLLDGRCRLDRVEIHSRVGHNSLGLGLVVYLDQSADAAFRHGGSRPV